MRHLGNQETVDAEDFSSRLKELKNRSGRSYEALGKRVGISSSAMHRYCTGEAVPPDFATVERIARACQATRDEVAELRRFWYLAGLRREAAARAVVAETEPAASDEVPADLPPADDGAQATPSGDAPRWRRPVLVAAAIVVVLVVGGALLLSPDAEPPESAPAVPLLLSSKCPPVMKLGDKGGCVRELQTLLYNLGGELAIDGDFGPRTRMRTIGFQVLAGLPATGEADERTKRAVYAKKAKLRSWPVARVEERIAQVFPEEPQRAVAVARCLSRLDPLWVLPNINGTNNWGVFQIYDRTLEELGATPLEAFDPEKNIQLARRLWERTRDFSEWESCGAVAPQSR